ncbi:MAG: NADH-quinone oxidoreductase subunit L [Elusimicrobia bacterium]|nr:NADH-quinone oxidoreductase subunit L [Elusimicrobiota bacterium]
MHAFPMEVYVLLGAPVAALFLGFFVFRRFKPEWTHLPILASCAAVCAASVSLAARVCAGWGMDAPFYTWVAVGDVGISFGARLDGLSISVLAMVSLVGGLIHVYAWGYMKKDPGFSRFFLLFHLFFFAMIGLLISNNYVQLYLFWELVGVSSYFLIGFWHQKESARRAALQAFMVNRVGDFGLMLGVLILMATFKANTRFSFIFQMISLADPGFLALAGLCFFWAACAKSAQFPLYFWLPDAMEGPTPVSALMHAATMVTAGVFLLARSWPLISAVAFLGPVMALTGAFTCAAAALLACTRTDLKRILAYSTVSHLGLMVFALGLGQTGAAVFHLVTHGFFKAVLFLCAGNIAHALHKPTVSLSEAGGLYKKMPLTFFCFTVAALSLAGVWPFAGFFSKDAILEAALRAGGLTAATGILIGVLSAFYIFRMLFLTFLGARRSQARPLGAHEAEAVMAAPMFFLSLGALGVGWLAKGFISMLRSGWVFAAPPELPPFSMAVLAVGSAAAAAGIALAWVWSLGRPEWDWEWRRRWPGLERLLNCDFGWKHAAGLVARAAERLSELLGRLWDRALWDGLIESSGSFSQMAGEAGGLLATGLLNDYLWWMLAGVGALLTTVLWL